VFENVTIAYRGPKYEVGVGRDFYAIWAVGAPRSQPLERWPATPEGWTGAMTKFTELEPPGTFVPVGRRSFASALSFASKPFAGTSFARTVSTDTAASSDRAPSSGQAASSAGAVLASASTGSRIAAGLLAIGVAFGIAGLFPGYFGGASLAAQPAELVPHAIYLAAWTASAALVLLGGARLRAGALLGTGASIVTFGLFLAEAGTATADGAHMGAGLVLGLVGWLACAAGSVLALRLQPGVLASSREPGALTFRLLPESALARPRGRELGAAAMLVLVALGTAIAFAPAWDSYVLRASTGATESVTAGNAFANPALVIAGDVAVMVAFVGIVVVAALWRPVRHGAVLLAGAIIPMAAQAVSALVLVREATGPTQFGISSAQATQLGLTISNGLTSAFWIYCALLIALAVSCAWMLITPHPAVPQTPDTAGSGSIPTPLPSGDEAAETTRA
jgi:hypothetical protein